MYEPKLEFSRGVGVQTKKNPPRGGVWIFSGTTQYKKEARSKITLESQYQKGAKWAPYLRSEKLKNHTLFPGTNLYSLYTGVQPTPPSYKYTKKKLEAIGNK